MDRITVEKSLCRDVGEMVDAIDGLGIDRFERDGRIE